MSVVETSEISSAPPTTTEPQSQNNTMSAETEPAETPSKTSVTEPASDVTKNEQVGSADEREQTSNGNLNQKEEEDEDDEEEEEPIESKAVDMKEAPVESTEEFEAEATDEKMDTTEPPPKVEEPSQSSSAVEDPKEEPKVNGERRRRGLDELSACLSNASIHLSQSSIHTRVLTHHHHTHNHDSMNCIQL